MPDQSDNSDDDNQSRKRHLLITENDSPSKRVKPSALGSIFAPFTSLFGMFRGSKPPPSPTERVHEVSDDVRDHADDDIVVVGTSPKQVQPTGAIIFLNADTHPARASAGTDPKEENGQGEHVEVQERKEEEAEIVVEKHIHNVVVSDDSDENDVQEVAVPSVSTPKRPVIKTSEVQDDELTVQFVKLVKTPNRDLQNARQLQQELIFLNENQDDDASSVQFDSADAAVFASPTPDESVSRPRTPAEWNFSSPSNFMGSRKVHDYWGRQSSSKKPTPKRSIVRHPDAPTFVKKLATSQIQKTSKQPNQGLQEIQLEKYMRTMIKCGYVSADTSIDLEKSKKKTKGKISASELISKAKKVVAGMNGSRSTTPSILSRDSSVILERTPAGAQTPSSSSDFGSAKSEKLSNVLSKLENIQLDPTLRAESERYKSVYETNKRKAENLGEELRIRGGHREQTKEDRFEHVRKDLEIRGIVIRPKPPKKVIDEFMKLPQAADDLIERAWTNRLNQEELFVDAFSYQICRKDLLTLNGLNWLNDNIINFYLQLICQRSIDDSKYPKVYAFNTFFYTNIVGKGYGSVKRWTRKVDIFAHEIVLIPVHLGMHWCMAVVDFPRKRVEFYDSLYNGNTVVLPALRNYLCEESMDKKKVAFDFNGWTLEQMEDIPRQKNGSDCGVFSCQFGEWATRRKIPEFSQKHMPYYRKRMAHEIVSKQLLSAL